MAPRLKRNGKIDEEIEETFPASDPPSFMGGEVLGAPRGRRSTAKKKVRKKTPMRKAKRPAKKKPAAKKKARATKKRTRR